MSSLLADVGVRYPAAFGVTAGTTVKHFFLRSPGL